MTTDNNRAAFFYGTLMAPQVLSRVCHGTSDPNDAIVRTRKLKAVPAVLHGYQRHRVRDADYPAILPVAGASVRGTYVSGLSEADIWRLDIFEGPEYRRDRVRTRLLTSTRTGSRRDKGSDSTLEAETYVWSASPDDLEDREWDFEEFQREKMCFWVGAEGAGEYAGRASILG